MSRKICKEDHFLHINFVPTELCQTDSSTLSHWTQRRTQLTLTLSHWTQQRTQLTLNGQTSLNSLSLDTTTDKMTSNSSRVAQRQWLNVKCILITVDCSYCCFIIFMTIFIVTTTSTQPIIIVINHQHCLQLYHPSPFFSS